MKRLKLFSIALAIVLLAGSTADAPIHAYLSWKSIKRRVRITAYSCKQPHEKNILADGRKANNELGFAVPRDGSIPLGSYVELPNNKGGRYADDKTSIKASKKFKYNLIDIRWYESIRSKPKTRAVNRELCKRFDMGYAIVTIYLKP